MQKASKELIKDKMCLKEDPGRSGWSRLFDAPCKGVGAVQRRGSRRSRGAGGICGAIAPIPGQPPRGSRGRAAFAVRVLGARNPSPGLGGRVWRLPSSLWRGEAPRSRRDQQMLCVCVRPHPRVSK